MSQTKTGLIDKKKNGVIIYDDYVHFFRDLPPQQSKDLIVAVLEYHKTGLEPKLELAPKLAFNQIRLSVDRDNVTYIDTCKRNAENARKRWEASASDRMPSDAKHADKDKEKDKDNIIRDSVLDRFKSITGKKIKVFGKKAESQLRARLKEGYTESEIVTAIQNCHSDEFHQKNPKYLTLEFITRQDKLDKYLTADPSHGGYHPIKEAYRKVNGIPKKVQVDANGLTQTEWKEKYERA